MAIEVNLPDAGPGRWWKVELVPGSINGKPMKVSLMQSVVPGLLRGGLSTVLASVRTIAQPEAIDAAGQTLMHIVNDYDKYVGFYPKGVKKGGK